MQIRLLIPSLVAALVLTACADTFTAPVAESAARGPVATAITSPLVANAAERIVEQDEYDLTGIRIGCNDAGFTDVVRLEGAIREQYTTLFQPSGGVVNLRRSEPHGLRGVSERTGEEYRVLQTSHAAWYSSPELEIGGWRDRITFRGTESGARFYIDFRVRFLYNEHNQRVIERDDHRFNCYV